MTTPTPRRYRRLWPALAAALAVNAAAGYALVDATATRDELAADQKSVTWQVPQVTPAPVSTTGTSSATTPAGRFLDTLAATPATDLLGTGISSVSAAPAGTSLRPTCWDEVASAGSLTLVGSGPGGGVSVQLLATPAGAGTATVAGWLRQAGACTATVVASSSKDVHPQQAPAGFTVAYTAPAPARSGKVSPLTQVVWSRGDVVALLTYGTGDETSRGIAYKDLPALTAVVDALDSALVSALTPVCVNLAPTAGDVVRNPALDGYVGYQRTEQVPVPAAPTVTAPTMPVAAAAVPLPEAAAVDSLAPVAAATGDDWLDSDDDGDLDTLTALAKAPRGAAPVLRDPTQFTAVTPGASDPGVQPQRPAATAATVTYQVTMADPQGPGCGWDFTGQDAPQVDEHALQAAAATARESAIADAGAVQAAAWAGQLAWARQWQAWAAKEAAYAPVRDYEQAKADAATAWADAAAVYQASVDAWKTASATPPTDPDTPDDTPTPSPTTKPEPTPKPGPSASPGIDPTTRAGSSS